MEMERELKIGILTCLVLFAFLFIADYMKSYDTLEEAVQSEWKTPIEVVNQDEKLGVVYYLDNAQHVVDVYQEKNGKYRYNDRYSTGTSFGSNDGLAFYIQVNKFKEAGNVIYGAIQTDEQVVEKFVIEYKNGKKQEITAKNNTFIVEYPNFLNQDTMLFQESIENVIGYDQQGNIIERYF